MARVPYVEPDGAPEDVARVYASVRQRAGHVLGFFKALAHFPAALAAAEALLGALRRVALDPKLRELAYLKTSQLNGCAY
jgi:alkylhydroperoxidase family enzyme